MTFHLIRIAAKMWAGKNIFGVYFVVHKAHRPLIDCPEENCEFQTRSNMSMKIHMRNKHEGKQKFFVCEFCGKRLGAKATYETHLRRHRAQYIFKCVKCPAAFPCKCHCFAI